MASTNIIQWDPSSTNQETDASYLTDTVRLSGGAVNGLLPSATFNKFGYQVSTFCTAFANALVNKGFSPTDTSLAALTTVLQNVLTTADVRSGATTVPYSPNPVFNASNFLRFDLVLTGNVTSATLVNIQPGDLVVLQITQGGGGGFTMTWPSNCYGTSDVGPDAGAVSVQMFYVNTSSQARAVAPIMIS